MKIMINCRPVANKYSSFSLWPEVILSLGFLLNTVFVSKSSPGSCLWQEAAMLQQRHFWTMVRLNVLSPLPPCPAVCVCVCVYLSLPVGIIAAVTWASAPPCKLSQCHKQARRSVEGMAVAHARSHYRELRHWTLKRTKQTPTFESLSNTLMVQGGIQIYSYLESAKIDSGPFCQVSL